MDVIRRSPAEREAAHDAGCACTVFACEECDDCTQPDEDTRGEDEPGACAWGSGAYGRIGTVHYAIAPDGTRDECCTFG